MPRVLRVSVHNPGERTPATGGSVSVSPAVVGYGQSFTVTFTSSLPDCVASRHQPPIWLNAPCIASLDYDGRMIPGANLGLLAVLSG